MQSKPLIKIDYDNSILSVSNSILKHFNVAQAHASLPLLDTVLAKGYTNVVLLILDGMGINVLKQNLPENAFLNTHLRAQISSVFPPTTAAATTAIHSGLAPIESGWLGWMVYFKQYDKIIEVFRNKEFYSGMPISEESPSEAFIKYKTIYQKIVEAHPQVEYHRVFPAFEQGGVQSFEELCARVQKITAANNHKKIIAAYWIEPDHLIHRKGVCGDGVKPLLAQIDNHLKNLYEQLEDTLVIITADHGMIDVEDIILNDYPDVVATFKRLPALEDRFVTFFIKEDCKQTFENLFHQYFSTDFVLFTKEAFLSSGILGQGKMHALIPDMLGEYIIIALNNKNLLYMTPHLSDKRLIAGHSGYTQTEMNVPLILLEK